MYNDYFYEEDPKQVDLFPGTNKTYSEKKRQQKRQPLPKKKKSSKILGNKTRDRSSYNQTKKAFQDTQNHANKVSRNVENIAKGIEMFSKLALLAGTALFGINKFLDLQSMTSASSVYGGSAPYGKSATGASGRSSGKVSEKGLQMIRNKEGFREDAYHLGKEKYWTIGYGHSGPDVKPGDKITKDQAEKLLKNDVARFENAVNRNVKVPISQNMFDALVVFCYNVGPGAFAGSTLLKKLNKGDYKGAQEEFAAWNKVKDKAGNMVESKGLTKRRAEEAALFGIDIGTDNKLKTEIAEVNPYQEMPSGGGKGSGASTNVSSSIGKLSNVQTFGNGAHYSDASNITSHTKLTSGTNKYYDASKGEMGTFMGKTINSGIGHRSASKASSFHRGLDLKYAYGTPVYSFTDGKVTFASTMGAFGRIVIVDDANKYRHLYAHLSKISVSNGKQVKKGDLLGYSGGSSMQKGKLEDRYFAPHLHYGIWKPGGTNDRSAYIDPRTYTYPGDMPVQDNQSANTQKLQQQQKQLSEQDKKQQEAKQKQQQAKTNVSGKVVNYTPQQKNNTTNTRDIGQVNPYKTNYQKNQAIAKKGK